MIFLDYNYLLGSHERDGQAEFPFLNWRDPVVFLNSGELIVLTNLGSMSVVRAQR